jgi:hypothetical protein
MVRNQAREVIRAIINSEIIVGGVPCAQFVSTLPVEVCANPFSAKRGSLPLAFDAAFVGGHSILLHETGLIRCCAGFAMSRNPVISK